ncbi:restriction endonuclease subunit S [Sinanaerobacter chloroacetimidivorans]|uniref:Restriction endonuclease subunit S n=1 Tax=Sinanaerobacter chloroacetimidivorans TaxID=2818044 RepID=A0A8J8B3A8_9FIRM|nr:restriction endonuclease subunit S [Sinanaerobacter chloroacetimidivorans]MBR0598120.1 restriction endonuclease subunit S [Sinanaerobacter chloroacetimidivorans]
MSQDWKITRISDICKTNPNTYSVSEKWSYVNYLDTGSITENSVSEIQHLVIGRDTLPSRARRKVVVDDILYSTVRPNQRHYGIVKDVVPNMLVSTGFAVIRVDKAKADADYLYYYLTQNDIVDGLHAIGEQSVSAYPSIKPSDIESIELLLPSLPEQVEIGRTLKALDDKIANNTKINHHLEQMAQAIFKSWFVDFEPFGGEMPADWRDGTISDLGDVIGGSTPSKAKPEYYTEHGIAWITPKDLSVNKSKFITHGADDITELGLRNSSARLMPRGTVLFSSRAPIGYIAIASGEVCTNQGFKSIVPKESVGTAFIYYFLIENLQSIENMASGSTFKEVSGTTMKGIPAVIPDDDTLRRFQEECTPIFAKQELLEAENARLAEIRDSLLPRLMSGELSVVDLGDAK